MTVQEADPRVEELTRVLAAEYRETVRVETVRRCVADACARFADARIDAYLPLFVARHARRLIQADLSAPAAVGHREL